MASPPPAPVDAPYLPAGVAGKTILITGGASGFGAAFSRHWAKHGAYIMIGDIDETAGEKLVAELRMSTKSPHHHFQVCDVTRWQSQVSLFQMARRASPTGTIDAVVPCAGVGEDMGGSYWRFEHPTGLDHDRPPPPKFRVMDVNLTGVMYTIYLGLFWLQQAEGGAAQKDRHILLVGSIGGLLPLVGSTQYTASKHALTGLFRCLRLSAWQKGIRINMLCPVFVDTKMLANPVMFVLAGGGGLADMADVVDAATRFMADQTYWGRSVVIGPRMKVEDGEDGEVKLIGLPKDGKGVWECYAQDYQSVEAFIYRYTRLLIAVAKLRGWFGWLVDALYIKVFRKSEK
ncbi:NAD(P)-binding domain protein [Niveomyces insectorum RCEF 264]|uniref:NAD(P)-binding domain protein n=1 Tax=Niveomyces insectorum RCEF 264 TaxID=1081102 RepID=A0A167T8A8_9HYPO|nr:NAD(P)-binding domain protein [Niveomyces insectorum RCEF 264]